MYGYTETYHFKFRERRPKAEAPLNSYSTVRCISGINLNPLLFSSALPSIGTLQQTRSATVVHRNAEQEAKKLT